MRNPYKTHSTEALYKKLDDMKVGDKRRQEVMREVNNRVQRFAQFQESEYWRR